jgi:hypothetical protein
MSISERAAQKRAEAVQPFLEPGETVRASFLGQTPVPPWVFFLIASYVFIFVQRYRVVAATDRNLYVMQNKFLSSYRFNGVAHKTPLASAQLEYSGTWLKIDGGPKLWVPPWGPIKRGLTELLAYVESQRGALPQQAGVAQPAAQAAPPPPPPPQ